MMVKIALPAWAKKADPAPGKLPVYIVNIDVAYPAMLAELADMVAEKGLSGFPALDLDNPHRYWVEVAFQCIKMDLQLATEFPASVDFRFVPGSAESKQKWALKNRPGTAKVYVPKQDPDELRATKGREAREHYRAMRGFLPA